MALLNNISIRGKIIALAVTVAVGLVAILWLGNNALTAASERLTELEQVYYPVLARSTANAQQLERMAETFSTAVTIGELDALANSDTLLASMQEAFRVQRDKLPAAAATIDDLMAKTSRYHSEAKALASGLIDGSVPIDQIQAKATAVSSALETLKGDLASFLRDSESAFTSLGAEANANAGQTRITNRIIGIIVLLIVGTGGWLIAGNISRSVLKVARSLEAMAQGDGDLTVRLHHDGKDELAELVNGFNDFISKLRDSIRAIVDSVSQLRATTGQLADSSNAATAQIAAQGNAIEQTTTALSEMFMTVKHVAEHAADASHAATSADTEARSGSAVVDRTIAAINDLAGEVASTAQAISQLEGYTSNVGTILATIRGIAEQTNLLALNAAIEAARAGEQGRGFAVVADEVRNLASRTQQSTVEIQEVLGELQQSAKGAVQAMQRGTDMARRGVEQSDVAGNSLRAITDKVSAITVVNSQIATATEEQAQTSQLIQGYVHEIHLMAQDAISATSELDNVSQALQQVTDNLNRITGQFRV